MPWAGRVHARMAVSPSAVHGRGAPGVHSSNTPPSTSIYNDNDEIWIGSEDWLEWVVYVEWKEWDQLNKRLKEAKENAAIENCPP